MQKPKKKRVKRRTAALNTTVPEQTETKIDELIGAGFYNTKSAVIVDGVNRLHTTRMKEVEKR